MTHSSLAGVCSLFLFVSGLLSVSLFVCLLLLCSCCVVHLSLCRANLSDLYFKHRQDRYIAIRNNRALCDFYSFVIDSLSDSPLSRSVSVSGHVSPPKCVCLLLLCYVAFGLMLSVL